MTVARVCALLAATAMAAACTADPSPSAAQTTPTPAAAAATAATAAPPTPQEAAFAAYERYMTATVEAMAAGEADSDALTGMAAGQALAHARRRLRANRRDGVVVTGALEPSATAADVEVDAAQSSARVTDCVLNGLEQVAADDPGEVVTAATGWRQPVRATVERRDGEWVVTRVRVPLRDGSGSVPPPPDDPPYLRGPAQGPAPPSCVPDDLAQAAVRAYEAFRDAYDSALGLGRTGPADPDLPALAATAVDPQLSAAQDFAASLAADGKAFRGEPDTHDPWAVSANDFDERIVIYDCVAVGTYGAAAGDAQQPASVNSDADSRRLDAGSITRVGDEWKVANVSLLEEGLDECTSSAQPNE